MVCQFCSSENTVILTRNDAGITIRKVSCSKCGTLLRIEHLQTADNDAATLEERFDKLIASLDDISATLKTMSKQGV